MSALTSKADIGLYSMPLSDVTFLSRSYVKSVFAVPAPTTRRSIPPIRFGRRASETLIAAGMQIDRHASYRSACKGLQKLLAPRSRGRAC
jgi:hypothetical protein